MAFVDRVVQYPGRVKLTPVSGQTNDAERGDSYNRGHTPKRGEFKQQHADDSRKRGGGTRGKGAIYQPYTTRLCHSETDSGKADCKRVCHFPARFRGRAASSCHARNDCTAKRVCQCVRSDGNGLYCLLLQDNQNKYNYSVDCDLLRGFYG